MMKDSGLTALAARQAVPPCGLRFHRSLPRRFPAAWFKFVILKFHLSSFIL
jgi:hypothetical protein